MGLRDLFTTARLVSLLAMASTTKGLIQTPGLSDLSPHDSNSTSSILLRLSSFMDRMDLRLETMEAKINNVERLDVQLETIEAKMNKIDRLDAKLETIEAKMQSLGNSFEDHFAGSKKEMGEMTTGIAIMNDLIVKKQISFIKGNVQNSWQQLQLNTEEYASKTLNAFQSLAKKLKRIILRQVKSAIKDLFKPKRCRKNQSVYYPFSAQYTIISGSTIPGIDNDILCDMLTDGGGWIVIQRRYTGEVDFYRNWASYKAGFGSLDNEFWLGNDNIHTITSTGKYELMVEIKYRGQSKFANYGTFSIDGEEEKYKLHVGSYSGTAGDSLEYHNGQKFSTFDQDDVYCAKPYFGAWWYKACHKSNLNGKWGHTNNGGLSWYHTTGVDTVEFSEMKIRRLNK
ncbi:hypothetical protein EGW08_005465 [Elysia chlorotica]|uniref:Fibrinogen C-terminal domain-containing protein n=1 Tax=Elysia chlorotica TaxID=188477 RepID=A0A433TZ25_ELYCH|nr:hypothetical protein EGW08_005465 [Elysia chlorotica]